MPPTATVRQTPNGIKMDDGFRTLVTLGRVPNAPFWEKSVKPPGLDGGDAIDTTTMHNVTYRTRAPRALKTMTPMTVTAAWDPVLYIDLLEIINVEDTITVRFPDGSTDAFYGFVQTVDPSEMSEGNQPEISITITPTNQNPTTGAESAAVVTSVAGT
jgi:hypothetical protein